MLTVSKLTGTAAAIMAYAEGRAENARGDYYLSPTEASPERARVAWSPDLQGNVKAGLVGAVDREAFECVMTGRDPQTSERVITAHLRRRAELAEPAARDAAYAHAASLGIPSRRRRALTIDQAAALRSASTAEEARAILRTARRTMEQPQATNGLTQRVAGVDLTFSAPKSVSLAWGLTEEPHLRTALEQAHTLAARRALRELEDRALVGRARSDGRRIRVPLCWIGIEAVHSTARLSAEAAREDRPPDPDLHTHVVIANMGWDAPRQKWRAVDAGTLLHMRSLGDGVYLSSLAEQLHRLGLVVRPNTGRDGRYLEVAGIQPAWIEAFSARAHEVRRARELLGIETDVPARALGAATRRGKGEEAEQDHTAAWREHLGQRFGSDALRELGEVLSDRRRQDRAPLAERQAELLARFFGPEGLCAHEASHTGIAVEATLWHLNGGRLTSQEMTELVPRVLSDPRLVVLDDGRYTTGELLRQELTVDRAGRWLLTTPAQGGIREPTRIAEAVTRVEREEGIVLDEEQRTAVELVTNPSRRLSLLGGRAGTGKTMTLRAARTVWEAGGREVVVVSVAAATGQRSAREIGAERGMTFEEFETRRRSGVLDDAAMQRLVVVIDEAAMADTPRLASVLSHVGDGTVVGLGDERQLQSVGAGGGWLRLREHAREVGAYAELTRVHRQRYQWERKALDDVREGRGVEAVAAYRAHNRIRVTGTRAEARQQVAEAWDASRRAGAAQDRPIRDYVMVAATRDDVEVLNEWAQGLRQRCGELGPSAELRDRESSYVVHRGDRVRLEGRLDAMHPNGIRGTVVEAAPDVLTVEWDGGHHPVSAYHPSEHAEQGQLLRLDYAGTAQRTQGTTAEQAFVLPSPEQRLEALYSAFSRAREQTTVYLDAKTWGERLSELGPTERRTIDQAELVARLAVGASESAAKWGALDAEPELQRRGGSREARVEAARLKLDALERAVTGSAARAAGEVDQPIATPSISELAARVQSLRQRAGLGEERGAEGPDDAQRDEQLRGIEDVLDNERRAAERTPPANDISRDEPDRDPGREAR
jgi:conjugative relaxase-like TrwC/TraI family protein